MVKRWINRLVIRVLLRFFMTTRILLIPARTNPLPIQQVRIQLILVTPHLWRLVPQLLEVWRELFCLGIVETAEIWQVWLELWLVVHDHFWTLDVGRPFKWLWFTEFLKIRYWWDWGGRFLVMVPPGQKLLVGIYSDAHVTLYFFLRQHIYVDNTGVKWRNDCDSGSFDAAMARGATWQSWNLFV